MTHPSKRVIAAFDFDETLTFRDTLLPFLCFAVGKKRTYFTLTKILPKLIGYLLKIYSRKDIKEALLSNLLAEIPYREIKNQGLLFAQKIVPPLLNPKMMARMRWHQQQGHSCVIVSAAMDFYVQPWGKLENFDEVIASRCQVNSEGFITGRLEGENCWGSEKVRRLEEKLGPKRNYILYAYGDSEGDKELLELADHPFYRYQGK